MSECSKRIAGVTLELGGKSAAIIADDIELDPIIQSTVFNAIGHSGQICAALTRVLIRRDRQEKLVSKKLPALTYRTYLVKSLDKFHQKKRTLKQD